MNKLSAILFVLCGISTHVLAAPNPIRWMAPGPTLIATLGPDAAEQRRTSDARLSPGMLIQVAFSHRTPPGQNVYLAEKQFRST
ncbi:hypothetical protein DFP72DRAFT_1063894 [Ephemerocybe angulata]|uniref:Uncharacterized protein n=1 Tax=Ephemerocybe angulata TaxID=980116 RepID=A0A8H6I7Y5_9AGAR|nr:hypothetical protein DFP72DRAFT_1063894 [Tulosesus angulatus]